MSNVAGLLTWQLCVSTFMKNMSHPIAALRPSLLVTSKRYTHCLLCLSAVNITCTVASSFPKVAVVLDFLVY